MYKKIENLSERYDSMTDEEKMRDEAYQNGVLLFLGRQDWMNDEDWEYFTRTGGNAK